MKAILRFFKNGILFVLRGMVRFVEGFSFTKHDLPKSLYGKMRFGGNYPSWEVAKAHTLGYDDIQTQKDGIESAIEIKNEFLKNFRSQPDSQSSAYLTFSQWPHQSHLNVCLMYAVSKIQPGGGGDS